MSGKGPHNAAEYVSRDVLCVELLKTYAAVYDHQKGGCQMCLRARNLSRRIAGLLSYSVKVPFNTRRSYFLSVLFASRNLSPVGMCFMENMHFQLNRINDQFQLKALRFLF